MAHEYLTDRGLTEETITAFGLGYSNIYSDDLYKYLKLQGYSDDLLLKAGLISVSEKNGVYDKFWNRVMFPIMDALEYIHSYDVVHLDIKPSNIMVENGNNVRLMDLGISNTADELMHDSSKGFIGTPKYAAPEQFGTRFSSDCVNHTTDIYCLGITIYELITGKNPYRADNLVEGAELRRKRELPYHPGIPNAVIDVLRKATAYQQGARYRSVYEFKNALQEAMNSKKENRWPLIIGVSSAVIILTIIILSINLTNKLLLFSFIVSKLISSFIYFSSTLYAFSLSLAKGPL